MKNYEKNFHQGTGRILFCQDERFFVLYTICVETLPNKILIIYIRLDTVSARGTVRQAQHETTRHLEVMVAVVIPRDLVLRLRDGRARIHFTPVSSWPVGHVCFQFHDLS
jgi:hypothetical protein